MAFIRKIKKGDATYLAKVESYREDGKVKQRVLEYIGKEESGVAVQKVDINKLELHNVKRHADVAVLCGIAKQLNLNYLLGKHHKPIIALLIAHLVCKGSISMIGDWIEHSTIKDVLGLEQLDTKMLYNALDFLEECDFDAVEESLFALWKKLAPKDNGSFVLDVTDTYYNGKNDESNLRKGKDGKVSKLVQIGLGVSFENGLPIFHKMYNGNISNIKVLEDLMIIMSRRGIPSIIMDRGFYSEANVTSLQKLGMQTIVGVKQSAGIKTNILSTINRDSIYTKKCQVALKDTFVYVQEVDFLFGKLVIIYNPKYEALKRDKMLATGSSDAEAKYVGFSLIFHNTVLKPDIVVKKYFDKDIVERSFRTMKGDVQLHPIRLWMPQRVKAHIKICYLSLCMLSYLQYRCRKLHLSASAILKELQTVYKVKLKHKTTKQEFEKVVTLSNTQKDILKLLKCSV
ncbi:MAG: transposase [Agriterribacter sp.]